MSKSQFMKNNVMSVVKGGGGKNDAAPGSRSGSGGTVGAPTNVRALNHGNSASRQSNNKGSRSKMAAGK